LKAFMAIKKHPQQELWVLRVTGTGTTHAGENSELVREFVFCSAMKFA